MDDRPRLDQLKIIIGARSTSLSESFPLYKEGEIPCAKNKNEVSSTYQTN